MTIFRVLLLVAAPLALSQPASAQERDLGPVINFWTKLAVLCIEANDDESLALAERLKACDMVADLMDRSFADPDKAPRNQAEANVFWSRRSAVHSIRGTILGRIDGVRSRRVCEEVQSQWKALLKVRPEAYPARYHKLAESHERVKASAAKVWNTCREEFGL
ncbi:MAG: hypothetical protein GVX90_04805 [Alphaproteobacteria bacterium]|jgi:hypothetical protein|nr:hypothetical protein [Alphaproteobacteria bacterium]